MSRRIFYIALLVAQFLGSALGLESPAYRVPTMPEAPRIDGRLEPGEWKDAEQITGLVQEGGTLGSRLARVWIGLRDDAVFVAIESELPPFASILASVNSSTRDDSSRLFSDDVTEFWFSPKLRNTSSGEPSYRLATNALGSLYTSRHDPRANQGFAAWSCKPVIQNSRQDSHWVTEMRLPLADLGVTAQNMESLGFRVARNWRQPSETVSTESWSGTPFSNADTMSRLVPDSDAPVIQQHSLGDWLSRRMHWELDLRNLGQHTQRLQINLSVASTSSMPPKVVDQTVELKPGEQLPLSLEADLFPDVICNAEIKICSKEDGREFFHREFSFETKHREAIWQLLSQPSTKATTFYIAFSPSENKLGFKISPLNEIDTDVPLRCEVRKVDAAQIVVAKDFPKPIYSTDGTALYGMLDLPTLEDGQYEVSCTSTRKDGGTRQFKQAFTRTIYPWEKNPLGCDRALPLGFPPLVVQAQTLKAALGCSTLSETGLPSEMITEDVSLLQAPFRLKGRIAGQDLEAKGNGLTITNKAEDKVTGTATWRLGALAGRTDVTVDYDGLLFFSLTLKPGQQSLDSLELEIPLNNQEITLLHQVGAGIRGNYAGKVPAGEGLVWTNLDAVAYGYPDNFIPYLWLGGTRRGLAWFADSSTGWAIGPHTPALEITRQRDTLTLKLRLISQTTPLDHERIISFGLQMTPLKNRPSNWRRIDFVERFPAVETVRILGSCPYWGGISAFGDFYPRDQDFSILVHEYLATQKKEITSELKAFISKWNEGNQGLTNAEGLNRHVELAFGKAAVSDYLIPYTDAREIRESTPEFRTFQDEWVRQGFNPRVWSQGNIACVGTEAVGSFQDFALWYFKKMKDVHFAGGIYFDNDFPIARQNPFSEYRVAASPELGLQPSTGLLEMREYLKRAYQMFSADGHLPLNTIHMTNSALAPHLAFATVSLDWEMKYGASDFQDRFSQDYIFASTMGEQFGTIPLVLSGIFPSREKSVEWLTRSLIGTTFIYELKIFASSQLDFPIYKRVFDIIYGFGYGKDDCSVYRYWEDPPFQIAGGDRRGILLKREGRLLLMVTDFGEGGPTRVTFAKNLLSGEDRWTARDAESGQPIDLDSNVINLSLQKHEFKLIELTSTSEKS